MKTTNSSRAMKMAHYLYKEWLDFVKSLPNYQKKDYIYSKEMSICLKRAWYFERFRKWLKNGVVTFSYMKKDSSIRFAKGTLNDLLIPTDKLPKGTSTAEPNYSSMAYFDLERQDWRSFNVAEFVGFVTRFELKEKA